MDRFYVTSRKGHIMIMDRATGDFVQGAESARIADSIVETMNAPEAKTPAMITETTIETTRNDGAHGITPVWHTTVRTQAGVHEDVQVFESLTSGGRGQLIGHYAQGIA